MAGLSALAWAIIAVVASTAVSVAMAIKQKQEMEDAQAGLLIQKQGGTHPIPIVYGKRRIAPTKVWEDISNLRLPVYNIPTSADSFFTHQEEATYKSSHSNKNWLHRIDVYCQGPVSLISNIEVDDDAVNTHKRFTQTAKNRPIFRALNKHGYESQTMFSQLSSGFVGITQSMKGNGVAWSWNSFLYAKDDPQYYGNPQVTALVTGLLVWDPRVNPSDPSIKAWSDNPALILLDYLTAKYGKGLSYGDLDIASFMVAADNCDVVVTLPAQDVVPEVVIIYDKESGEYIVVPAGGYNPNGNSTGSQKRFTCNIALQPDVGSKENVVEILKTFKGALPFINGQYVLSMEVAASPVMSFDDSNIIDGVTLSYADRSKRLNQVTVKFPNALKGYKEDAVTWPKPTSDMYATLLAEDSGERLTTETKLSGVTSYSQAEDLAEFMVRDSRNQQILSFKTQPLALQLEPNDIIQVTTDSLSYTDRPYRVRSVKLGTDLTVEVVAQEYDPTVYPWYDGDPEPAPDYVGNTIFDEPSPVQGFFAFSSNLAKADGSIVTSIQTGWDDIVTDTSTVDQIYVGYKTQGATYYEWATVPQGETSHTIVGVIDNIQFDVAVKYRTVVGRESPITTAFIQSTVVSSSIDVIRDGKASNDDLFRLHQRQVQADLDILREVLLSWSQRNIVVADSALYADALTEHLQSAEQVAAAIASDTTVIDGSRITTGIINASLITTGTLSADRILLDGNYLAVVDGLLTIIATPNAGEAVHVADTTGNADPTVTVTRITGGKVSVAVDWSLSRNATAAHDAASPFPVTLTLTRDGTTIKTWTVAEGLGGVWQDGNVGAGEPFVAFGNLNAGYLDNSGASGSAVYTVSATTLSTSYFDLETQLTAQAVV